MDAWAVPLLWLALFRPKDVLRVDGPDDDGEPGPRYAPIAAKKTALAQLEAAVPYLNHVFKDQGPLDEHAALFRKVFSRSKLRFVCIDLLEVAYTENPETYYKQLLAALTALENERPPAIARRALLALTHLRIKKKFPPARCFLDNLKMTQSDAWNLARLFGTEWEEPVPWEPQEEYDESTHGETPLHQAAQRGDLRAVKQLLAAGADLNAKNALDGTPLVYSVSHPAIVKVLLEAGADPRGTDALGSALMFTPDSERTAVTKMLLDHGADPNGKKGARGQILAKACINGWGEVVRILLEAGADLNARDNETPLVSAVIGNRLPLIELLISRGADVNLKGKNGFSPMGVAKLTNNESAIALLRHHGARG